MFTLVWLKRWTSWPPELPQGRNDDDAELDVLAYLSDELLQQAVLYNACCPLILHTTMTV
jgi:hypothetical protein